MALISQRSRVADGIPTSSMADVAFLLLVFFLVTTVFPKDRGLSLVLPQGESEVAPTNVVHFLVDAAGVVGVRWGANPQTQFVRSTDVGQLWRSGVTRNPRLIASVHTDRDATYGHMIAVLDELHAAGAGRVSLQASER